MKIVDNFKTLTLGQFEQIQRILKSEGEDIDKQIQVLSVLSGLTEDEILALPITEYKQMVVASNFLGSEDMGSPRLAKSYTLGGLKLVPTTDFRKIITSQYVDFQELTKQGDVNEHIVEVLSIVLVPEGKTYGKDYDLADVQRAIRQYLSFADACALLAFFLNRYRALIVDSLRSSMKEAAKIADKTLREKTLRRICQALTLLQDAGDGSQM